MYAIAVKPFTAFLALALLLASGTALSQPGKARMYGAGAPFQLHDLPAGHVRSALERLPVAARQHAMSWLHEFLFPENDLEFLRIDAAGGVLYADTQHPDPVDPAAAEGTPGSAGIDPADTFSLHSRPGAQNIVYLDFDGHTLSGTAWNNGGVDPLYAAPFDIDDAPASFSSDERNRIAEIWHRVAEDFAPFDIDVTTEEPASFGPQTGRVLITTSRDLNGNDMPYPSAGGVAYVGVWGSSSYTYYSPALVYYDNLGSGYAPYVAEAASHELGHNLNLAHDGTSTSSYYSGHGNGLVSWGAIMGVGYNTNVTQWSNGEYPDANNQQDDLGIIDTRLGMRADDHGDSLAIASPLLVPGDGSIEASNPETDPYNVYPENKGIIESRTDVDVFSIDADTGLLTLSITPAWDAFYRDSRRGANLDIQAILYNGSGQQVAAAGLADDTQASLSLNIPAGRYYLAVSGVGNADSPYSDYGSLGQYFIRGSVAPASPDNTPPVPNPMGWASVPQALGRDVITMTASTASDDSGSVQYYFQCTAGGSGCSDSGWQADATWTTTGLAPDNAYSFRVKARDASGNETDLSGTAGATTAANMDPVAADDGAEAAEGAAVTVAVLANDSDGDGDTLSIDAVTQPAHGTVTHNSDSLTYTANSGYSGTDSFTYSITDGYGGDSTATVYVTVTAVNNPPVANNDSATVHSGASVLIDVLANDSDPDSSGLALSAVTQGNKGIITIEGAYVRYTAGSKRGGDSFTYTVTDGENYATATVTVSISRGGGGSGGGDDGGGGDKCHPKKGC